MEHTLLIRLRACVLLGATLLLAAGCAGAQSGQCKGGYPDASGISNLSPYSPNANPYTPPCTSKY
jgi:hypothetical protein